MVLSSSVMLLVDGDSGVNDLWGDCLLVDDGLNRLVDVMVNMLALNSWCSSSGVTCLVGVGGILELSHLGLESLTCLVFIAVVKLLVDNALHLVGVLLWEDLLVLDGLDGGVVVVLVDLAVNRLCHLLMSGGLDVLVGDSCGDTLSDISAVTLAGGELLNGGSGFVHFEIGVGGIDLW